jgi:hypothetical protein
VPGVDVEDDEDDPHPARVRVRARRVIQRAWYLDIICDPAIPRLIDGPAKRMVVVSPAQIAFM